MSHSQRHEPNGKEKPGSRMTWVFLAFAAIAAFFLAIEHKIHIAGWLSAYGIWLLLLACPLLHMFMHGGHGHRHETRKEDMK